MKKAVCIVFAALMMLLGVTVKSEAVDFQNIYGFRENDDMMIALTFDDGPHPKITPKILEILEKHDVKATFFMIGENVEYYPNVVRSVVEAGHEIGNHTYSHPHISRINEETLAREISKCDNAVSKLTGIHPKLFRPPEGVIDNVVKVISSTNDYSVILWRVDTRDWAGTSASAIEKNISQNVRSGDIILMHDYISKNCHTVEAVERIIPILLKKGYKFVTVSELIEK
jgi:polysaccharide deacetylase family sporulation protein PdaB